MKHIFIPLIATVVFVALPFVYWFSNGEGSSIYIQCITAGVALFFGYFNYKFQKETNELNRLSKLPALNVKKEEVEKDKVIHVENKNDYAAKNVYIGSFLFTRDGDKNKILYD